MRWGVRDEMTDEHMTTVSLNTIIISTITIHHHHSRCHSDQPQALCMNELRGCQTYSMGPNFIYFGAQK